MNTIIDKMIAASKITNPNAPIEEKAKELMKQYVKNYNLAPYHENNLIAIIENAKEADKMLAEMQAYLDANKLI